MELEWKECRLCTTKTCPTKNVSTKKISQAVEARHTYPICTPDSHDGFVQSKKPIVSFGSGDGIINLTSCSRDLYNHVVKMLYSKLV